MKKIRKIIVILLGVVLTILCSCSSNDNNEVIVDDDTPDAGNEPEMEQILLADPTIFYHEDTYYLYGTSQGNLTKRGLGFLVFTSSDLKNWEGPIGDSDGFALAEDDAFGDQGFWAPQVFEHNNQFYMAYTANESIAIATSDSPLGPFTNAGEALQAETKQIDPFVFFDDGAVYLYHVRLGNGNRIFVAEMNDDLTGIKAETLTECISATEQWENTEQVDWPVAEGPTVLKHDELYYLIYSANDFRNPNYAVGYATSDNPMGPWEKFEGNPIIDRTLVGESGPGHGDVFMGENNEMYYVLHTHFSAAAVHPRKTAVIELSFVPQEDGGKILQADGETFKFLERIKN